MASDGMQIQIKEEWDAKSLEPWNIPAVAMHVGLLLMKLQKASINFCHFNSAAFNLHVAACCNHEIENQKFLRQKNHDFGRFFQGVFQEVFGSSFQIRTVSNLFKLIK